MKRLTYILLACFAILAASSCSTTRVLQDEEYRLARNKIKTITTHAMQQLFDQGFSSEDAKKALITKFGVELLIYYFSDNTNIVKDTLRSNAQEIISQITHNTTNTLDVLATTDDDIQEFIRDYPFCCDDSLSWCYQYANKIVAKLVNKVNKPTV